MLTLWPMSRRALPVALLTSLLASCASRAAAPPPPVATAGIADDGRPPTVGQPMPDVAIQKLGESTEVRLSSLRGKVVLLDIWASWCLPCKDEMPVLDEIAARLGPRGLEVIAISVDEERRSAQSFLDTRPRWALTLAHDPEQKIPARLQPEKMPTSYVIDAGGILRHINYGFLPGDGAKLEAQLSELLSITAQQQPR
jgi:cytochrome c biogenesis protein CcmG, thiol:disulfide interchange protein DsbE